MTNRNLQIVNIERINTLPGGIGYPHDRAVVIDHSRTERHILTGAPQPVVVFRGTLSEAHDFLRADDTDDTDRCPACGVHVDDCRCPGRDVDGR